MLRMKGITQGLKVTQVSLILIGLLCATVLALEWTKTTFLASFIPTQNHVLQLGIGPKEILKGNGTSVQTGLKQVDSLSSPGTGLAFESGYAENVTITGNGEIGVIVKPGLDELSAKQNKSKQAETVQENSSTVKSPVEGEHINNLSPTISNEEKISPATLEGSEEPSWGKDKSKQTEIVPEQTRNSTAMIQNKDCNYAKGKWVLDESWPLYSGYGCSQWLSSMWACRLTQRTDFEYEKLRWQPKDCKMEDFTGSKFLERMKNRTLAFVGDSLGRQQFQSLMCMVTAGQDTPDVLDVGHEYGLVKYRGAIRPDGWAYRFPQTNTTILYYWSASLCDLEPIDASNIAMHLDRPPAFLRRFLHKFDVLVLNTGHHWNRGKLKANRWVMYVGGVPNTNRKVATIGGAKDFTVRSIVKWVNLQLPLYPGLKAFLRTLAPRHFFNGEWNTGGTCDNTTPLSGGKEVVQDESSDHLAAGAVKGTDVKLLDITALSQLRDEGHISRYSIKATPGVQDCLHWCLPGIPDTWNEILFNQL